MRIITRYILFECLLFFGLSLFVFTGILLTVQMLKFSDLIINRGVRLDQIAMVFLSITPTFMELAIPMSALLGVMLAFARLSGDSEIVVLRSSGVSIYQMVMPVFFFALSLAIIGMEVSTQLKPWGYKTLAEALFDIAKSRSTAGLEEGVFNKLGDLTLYGQTVDYASGDLKGVMVDDRRDDKDRKVIFARTGSIVSDTAAKTITIKLNDGSMHEQVEGKYAITHFITNNVVMNPDELYGVQADKEQTPRSLYIPEILEQIPQYDQYEKEARALEAANPNPDGAPILFTQPSGVKSTHQDILKRTRRLRLEYQMRFSMPYAAFILALTAMPLGIQPPRTHKTWGPTVAFSLGLLVFLVYFATLSFAMTLVDSGKMAPGLAAWLPNFVVTAAAAWMIAAVASERIQSIPQTFEGSLGELVRFASSIRRRIRR